MRDVGFAYPRGGALFQGITLDLPRGSFQFLTGPSGSVTRDQISQAYFGGSHAVV